MTSGQESSDRDQSAALISDIESLAGLFHPHAIEVQDFSSYALVIDVRERPDFERDHIPGAVQIEPTLAMHAQLATRSDDGAPQQTALGGLHSGGGDDLPDTLAALVSNLKPDQAILVYCRCGSLDSVSVAWALRWRGWTVDVLPGGWINYRRWVQAGLEVLPRLLAFRVFAASLGCETKRVLDALSQVGHQVLDIQALAAWRQESLMTPALSQPSQALFESQLLQAIRGMDPRRPVWVADTDGRAGALMLPRALVDAIAIAPIAAMQVPLAERINRWREDEPVLLAAPMDIVNAAASSLPPPADSLVARWRELATKGPVSGLIWSLLCDHFDAVRAERIAGPARSALPPLVTDSLEPGPLEDAVRAWMSGREPR